MAVTALITLNPLAIVQTYVDTPSMVRIPGVGDVFNVVIGYTNGNFKLVTVERAGAASSSFDIPSTTTLSLAGNMLTITQNYTTVAPTAGQLRTYASNKQSSKAQSGTVLGATPIPTDLTSQILLAMAFTKASNDSTFSMGWIGSNGPITLTATNILNAARQVGTFLGQCKNAEAIAINSINAGTITTTAQIDALFNF